MMYIETEWTKNPASITDKDKAVGSMILTGRLGETMQESAKTAYTVARRYLSEIDPENKSLLTGSLHLHVPEVNNRIIKIPTIFFCQNQLILNIHCNLTQCLL